MTKREHYNSIDTIYCCGCKKELPKNYFSYNCFRLNGESFCNCCNWINRHGVPNVKGYSSAEVIQALYFLFNDKSNYLNDLCEKLQINLNEGINLFRSLKVGNKKCILKIKCAHCGKLIEKPLNVYLQNKKCFCSNKCYWEEKKKKSLIGKDNPCYNRIQTHCTQCNKLIEVIPYDFNKRNRFGDNHNFCSQQCYWNFRSTYYIEDKGAMFKHKYTEEQKQKIKERIIKNSRSSSRFNSGIQLKIDNLLNDMKIDYVREHIIKYYAVDNYLSQHNLIIEVMGDYWHTSPLKYNMNRYLINQTQVKGIICDKQKHSYIKNKLNIEILYLWENDINNRYDVCKLLIEKYILNQGVLENYHSFNWHIENKELLLNDNLIIPYQDMSKQQYSHLIKQSS